jgi:xylan 1,4-beta-xylosidase
MATVVNPILRGFNPDPSICRVGEDYYIATSTFEWFPGVQIHHSKDLVHWELICHPLSRMSQLDMTGIDSSCGIWAPCLSYCDGLFYLIYTNVKSYLGLFKDTPNYLVTAPDIMGPWSEPVYLNSSGFDPSLFHDRDGRKWLVNMVRDHRTWKNPFGGIYLQEYSVSEQKLIGEPKNIFYGTELGLTEGPHLYWHDGYYYLMVAEGGTGYEHAVTVARSKNIDGPYEVDPKNPILTANHHPELPIQKAGHACICDTPFGDWFMVHLCGRPVGETDLCILGRETCLQAVEWTSDGWLRMKNGTGLPEERVSVPYDCDDTIAPVRFRDDFDGPEWSIHFQTLRVPLAENQYSFTEHPGYLRLYGGECPASCHYQTLIARRQQHLCFTAETCVEFSPKTFQHLAGLIYLYDHTCYYYLHVTADDQKNRVINLIACDLGKGSYPIGEGISIPNSGPVWLRVCGRGETAQFYYSLDGISYCEVGEPVDATILSDDHYNLTGHAKFTGAFIGICCQDLQDSRKNYADFDYFSYQEDKMD